MGCKKWNSKKVYFLSPWDIKWINGLHRIDIEKRKRGFDWSTALN